MILITGANGFIGKAVKKDLTGRGRPVRGAVRRDSGEGGRVIGDIGPETDWREHLAGVDTVIHTAARVHVANDSASDSLDRFRRINAAGTRRLAEEAAGNGVKRLVFTSSIKVNGESTDGCGPDQFFTPLDEPRPADAYALSKLEAEQALQDVARRTGLEVVIIRPPLVYGPGVRANFRRLMHLVYKGVPLPLASVDNRRSMAALDNLVDLLIRCVDHPEAAGRTFLVSDGQDLSTPELIRLIARAMNRKALIFPFSKRLLKGAGAVTGLSGVVNRLTGSLRADIACTRNTLDWEPPVSVERGVRSAVDSYIKEK